MKLIEDLRAEHTLVDSMLGSLRAYVERRVLGTSGPSDAAGFLEFFRRYAGDFHHAREEEVLFAALVTEASLPADRGPLAAIAAQHRELAALLDLMEPLLGSASLDAAQRLALRDLAVRHARGLWSHLDAENSVLFPEAEERLRSCGIKELAQRAPSPAEEQARRSGLALLQRYPPRPDPDLLRGDGCVMCPDFGARCEGIEREWWSDSEREEFAERMGQGD